MKKLVIFVLCLGLAVPNLYAVGSSGFENASYSAKTLGQANAVIARPQDASTIVFNPAGMLELDGITLSSGLQGLDLRTFHRNQVTGDHNQSNAKLLLIPSFYMVLNPGNLLKDRFAFGIAANSPFGLANSFPAGETVGHYNGYKNYMRMIATTLAGAFKVTDWLNVGAGATNYWMYDYGQRFNYPNAAVLGIPGVADGMGVTNTDGFGWGWNVGLLAKPVKNHKVALTYRSKANIKVHGRGRIEDLVLGLAQGFDTAPHFETGIHSDVNLPWNWTVGYAYEPSKKWAVELDIGLTGWGVFKDQDFAFDRPNAVLRSLGTIPRDYHDTWSVHLGGHYRTTEKLDLFGGFGFYQGASPKNHFDEFLPDANRYFWSLGFGYDVTKRLKIDFAYMFMLFATRHISNPQVTAKSGLSIDGRYTSILHGAFLTATYQFDFPYATEKPQDVGIELTANSGRP